MSINIQQLEIELNKLSISELKSYVEKHYPKLYLFKKYSRKNIIDKILTYEENHDIFVMIEKRASR